MSFPNLLLIAAIVELAAWPCMAADVHSASPQKPPPATQRDQATEAYEKASDADKTRPIIHNNITVVVPEKDKVTPGPYEADCQKPKDHDDADLCEQRRQAKAAEDAVAWSEIQAWTGGIGAVLVFFSLIFAGIGAFAASRQVKLSRESLVSTDRAFMFPQTVIWNASVDHKSEKILNWSAAIQWKNSGNTPTKHLRFLTCRYVEKVDLPEDYNLESASFDEAPLLVAPGNTLETRQLLVTLEECDSIIAGDLHFFVYGAAEYDDVFSHTPRHRTEFCYRIQLGGNPRIAEKCSIRWNIHSRHNGADEECDGALKTSSMKEIGVA